jgi:hypothetical protein
MPVYLDTRANTVLSIAICDRCNRKFGYTELMPDPNFPGMRVCKDDLDKFDPWRLPARQTENIALRFPRPDVSIALTPNEILTTDGYGNNAIFIEGVPSGNTQGDLNTNSTAVSNSSLAATIYSVTPNSGPHAGGTSVTIQGTNFTNTTNVSFGNANAASFSVLNSTTIIAVTPPYAITGIVNVNVVTSFNTGTLMGGFTYT